MPRPAIPTVVNIKTVGEGRYLKAYLSFLAGRRAMPTPSSYLLSHRPERVKLLQQWAEMLYETICSSCQR